MAAAAATAAAAMLKNHGRISLLDTSSGNLRPLQRRRFRPMRSLATREAAPGAAAIRDHELVKESPEPKKSFKVTATITIRRKNKPQDLKDAIAGHLDAFSDMIGRRSVFIELISTQIDPRTKKAKSTGDAPAINNKNSPPAVVVCSAEFVVESGFGEPGAVAVTNLHQKEFFLESVVVEGFAGSGAAVVFPCGSWVQPSKDLNSGKRVFFSNKPYLPSETPEGLKEMRKMEMEEMRGDGKGARKVSDRIYDYATYNDLGDPDKGEEFVRPVLGGDRLPYPRRCRTGRPPAAADIRIESRVERPKKLYVPRDEAFGDVKERTLSKGRLMAVFHSLLPSLVAAVSSSDAGDTVSGASFASFHDIDKLYKEGLQLKLELHDHLLRKLPFLRRIQDSSDGLLRFDTPAILSRDRFAWLRDDEFGRQTLAGVNPVNIERLRSFPPVSELDPAVYGPLESAITSEHIAGHLGGMAVDRAMEEGRLFVLDYHDVYLPFVARINAMADRKVYATRTIFFLTPGAGTMKPVAVELALPPQPGGPPGREVEVVTPPCDATASWLWQLAKAHVSCNDAGVHQLTNHWLRTHACLEPFILAARRQLSVMHPLHKLLDPHTRYTLEINALARQRLINAGGVIESCFAAGASGMEMSAAHYRSRWRFDLEGLPADLLCRGMASPDPSAPHGLRLAIADYPYAEDGLLVWSAIEKWVGSYVGLYYPSPEVVTCDIELQSWYREAVGVGHADLAGEPWWPEISSPEKLASVITTLIWIASAQHASLNFGQYPIGGYVPGRPPIMRRLLPAAGRERDAAAFAADPQGYFLSALPGVAAATRFMAVADTLSEHSPDEEYLGERRMGDAWTADAAAAEGFTEFQAEMRRIEGVISERNSDVRRRNRCGAGVLPYELLVPSSGPGVTCKGVPNSVSI